MSQSPTLVNEEMMRLSGTVPVGSAFKRTEPERMNGSCGMVMIRERIISRGTKRMSMSSMVIVPESISMIRRRTERRELFPLLLSIN